MKVQLMAKIAQQVLAEIEERVRVELQEAVEKEHAQREESLREELLEQARVSMEAKGHELNDVQQQLAHSQSHAAELLAEVSSRTAAAKAVEAGYEDMRAGLSKEKEEAVCAAQKALKKMQKRSVASSLSP